jgi:ATP-dependent exoDNAse (exonuclease V) beta subunit
MAGHFKVYRASAGSGKTFTLVREFLGIALSTPEAERYRSILAITFTNKAAAEMRDRVVGTLRGLRDADATDRAWLMGDMLCHDLGLSRQELAARARATLTHMLHHYGELGISTIDRFTHRVVRTFARDLGLMADFDIELDADVLIEQVTDRLLAEVGQDDEVTAALMDLMDHQLEHEKSNDLTEQLHDAGKTLFQESGRLNLIPMRELSLTQFTEVRQRIAARLKEQRDELSQIAKGALAAMMSEGLTYDDTPRSCAKVFGLWANGDAAEIKATVRGCVEKGVWYTAKTQPMIKGRLEAIAPKLGAAVNGAEPILKNITELELIASNLYGVALLSRMFGLLDQVSEEQRVVHISELNHRVAAVVAAEPAPFVYERLGVRYRNFMVDEFQDTSVLQWLNLLPLVHEGLSKGEVSLIVGDGKQAIYRWRNGEVEQFLRMPKVYRGEALRLMAMSDPMLEQVIAEREQALEAEFVAPGGLNVNRRSLPEVVGFNNGLFAHVAGLLPENLRGVYDGAAQLTVEGSKGGYVEFRCIDPKNEGTGSEEEKLSQVYTAASLKQIEDWVRQCMADGYNPGDIAVLTRDKRNGAKVADHLTAQGFSVLSDDSLLIGNSPQVKLLMALFRHLHRPGDQINNALLAQLLAPVATDATPLAALRDKDGIDVDRLLAHRLDATQAAQLATMDIYSQLEWLRECFIGPHTDAYCHALIDLALRQLGGRFGDPEGFIELWDEKKDKLALTGDAGPEAIRVMTVHKSKGLEFPVVIHPFCDYRPEPHKNMVWDQVNLAEAEPLPSIRIRATEKLKETAHSEAFEAESERQQLDNANLLYVALTRAMERLYILCKLQNAERNIPAGQAVAQYVRGLDPAFANSLIFTSGAPTPPPARPAHPASMPYADNGCTGWQHRLRIRRSADDNGSSGRRLGAAVHKALERLDTAADIGPLILSLVDAGSIAADDAPALNHALATLVSHAEVGRFFDTGAAVRKESDLLLPDGTWSRPDRVLISGTTAQVLDYKTGTRRDSHISQVRGYMSALQQLGLHCTHGWLYYLDGAEAVEVRP